ncbi:hypothetical protein HEP86_32595 [Streptomyces sp. RPA4-5]|uniref:hypothetical protein n=1 Tax=Streptomyces TaxID=1883 RepID=UPI00143E3509|nr:MULTISPECIES: hypothetical protein [Streptomyces]MCX4635171.1 hypothetical protein [Streptomyces platensis]QIY58368.1 hypothetical protein HEP86_32595 [Streptomyces sp. RPA4-5]WJY41591.1 hypothetical protein QT196_32455 [Streptomyces sp. P9-2B-2]
MDDQSAGPLMGHQQQLLALHRVDDVAHGPVARQVQVVQEQRLQGRSRGILFRVRSGCGTRSFLGRDVRHVGLCGFLGRCSIVQLDVVLPQYELVEVVRHGPRLAALEGQFSPQQQVAGIFLGRQSPLDGLLRSG